MWVVVRTGFVTAPLRNSLGTLHHESSAYLSIFIGSLERAEVTRGLTFDGIFTLGIIRTTIKDAKASPTLTHFSSSTYRALYPRGIL